jgi:DNA repair protein RadD
VIDPFDLPDDRPKLLAVQADLLDRGRVPYANGAKRVLWQAPCGSGKTVVAAEQTRRALGLGRTVLHVVHRRRLVDQMIATLARFNIVAGAVMDGRDRWRSRVQCASRDTLLSMLKDGRGLPRADLVVWDEAHTAARAVQDWYLANCPAAYWTGYTATPVGSEGRSLNPPYEALVCMAPTSELLRIGRLCPVKVYNPDAVGRRRKKGDKVKPVGDPVDHWRKYADGLPTVVFAANVRDSRDLAARYAAAGVPAEHVDAATPDDEREAVYERSRAGKTLVVCNCGVLVEGVDLPWLVCCQILRGCNSLVLWVQATGRVMRSHPGKEHGIVLDHAGAAHEFGLPDSDFVWTLGDEEANEKLNKPPRDKKPVACPSCGAVFAGKAACPECGKVLPVKRRKSLMEGLRPGDGILTRYSGDPAADAVLRETWERLWAKLLRIGRANGWLMNRVAAVFTRETKCPPWEAGLDVPMPHGGGWQVPVSEWMLEHGRAAG